MEMFKPPPTATMADVMKWEDDVRSTLATISKMTIGGSKLREYIQKEVRRLQLLRFETFCKYVKKID